MSDLEFHQAVALAAWERGAYDAVLAMYGLGLCCEDIVHRACSRYANAYGGILIALTR